jgi:response regulator NasT
MGRMARGLLTGADVDPAARTSRCANNATKRMDIASSPNAEPLCVLTVERSGERARILHSALAAAGHRIVGRSRTAHGLHEAVERLQPDLVVIDAEGSEALFAHLALVHERSPRPVIVFSDTADPTSIRAGVRCGVAAYVVNGFAADRIEPVIAVALARFERDQRIRAERDAAQAKLAERKLVERAKGILMRSRGLGEEEAYHALRRIAMDRHLRMGEVAAQVIGMSDLLG